MKEAILNKSLKMFVTHGFKSITMDDIAKEMGISKKTIYLHFGSKNDLVKATVEYVYDSASNRMRKLAGKCESPIHEHFETRECVSELLGQNIQPSAIYQFNKYYPDLAKWIDEKRHNDIDSTIIRNLKEGVKLGLYRKDIDVDFVGRIFFVIPYSFLNNDVFQETLKSNTLEELNTKFLEYHLRGIVTLKGLEVLEQILKKIN